MLENGDIHSTLLLRWFAITSLLITTLFVAACTGGTTRLVYVARGFGFICATVILCRIFFEANKWTIRNDFFGPLIAFPTGYLVWFGIGSISMVDVPSSISFGLFDPIPAYVWLYIIVGLCAYVLGTLWYRRSRRFETCELHCRFTWAEDRFWLVIFTLAVAAITSYAYIVGRIGIPALSSDAGAIRLELSKYGVAQAVLFSSAWTLIPFLLAYLWISEKTRAIQLKIWMAVIFLVCLLFSLGGRSQVFVPFVVGFVIRHYIKGRLRLQRLALVLLVAFCAMGVFGYIRDTALTGDNQTATWLNVSPALTPFIYAYLYIRYPVATFRDLTEIIPSTTTFQRGTLTFGPLDTLLPGHHEQSDIFFKQLLGNDFIGAGQPATLLGPLYADGGIVGVLAGMLLFGLVTGATYSWLSEDATVFRVLIYAWIVQTGLFSLFSNLFPYITTLWIPLMWYCLNRFMLPNGSARLRTGSAGLVNLS